MSRKKGQVARSDKTKYEAVALYKLVGSLNTVSTMMGIPYDTIKKWHIQDWWKDYELDIVQSNRAKSNAKIQKIAEKAMVVVEDRLESGDYQLNQKTGNLVRIPVKADVANKILNDALTREEMNERLNQDVKKALTEEKMADRLLKIQESFKAIRLGRTLMVTSEDEVIDVDVVSESQEPASQG